MSEINTQDGKINQSKCKSITVGFLNILLKDCTIFI